MFFKRIFRKAANSITKEQAIQIAKAECEKREWSWGEPISATSRFGGNWEIRTNIKMRGNSARIIVDRSNGEVKKAGYLKR